MAAPIANDRKKGAEVRNLIMDEILRVFRLENPSVADKQLKKELLLRMCANTLPRLHEVTGEDGEPVKFQMINYADIARVVPAEDVPNPDPESV